MYFVGMLNMILLDAAESAKVEKLLADCSLDFLSAWEPGVYRALTHDGDDLGFVNCSANAANVVNARISRRAV